MASKISSKIGILLNWKPEDFDLDIARDHIKKKTKYAWGTGGIQLGKNVDNSRLDETILGLIKQSGQDEIKYGVTIDASKEFREYLNSHKSQKIQLHKKHKKYRPFNLKDNEARAFLFISDIFLLNKSIEANKIKLPNGNVFDPRIYRSAVFFDIKKSGLNAEEILDKKKDFDDYPEAESQKVKKTKIVEANEGERYTTEATFRARNRALIEAKKANSDYHCEVCNMSFKKIYGKIGEKYIIAHHVEPIGSRNNESKTTLDDISLVCANCHDMLHRYDPPMSISELRKIIEYVS